MLFQLKQLQLLGAQFIRRLDVPFEQTLLVELKRKQIEGLIDHLKPISPITDRLRQRKGHFDNSGHIVVVL